MKQLPVVFVALCFVVWSISAAFADQYVHGYTRSNGTVVQPYHRSSPNNTVTDNFSYKGNVNPHTGAVGTNRYIHDRTSPYYQAPDSHGRVGHSAASDPQAYHEPATWPGHTSTSDRLSINLCPPPHFAMTEQDGCHAVR